MKKEKNIIKKWEEFSKNLDMSDIAIKATSKFLLTELKALKEEALEISIEYEDEIKEVFEKFGIK